MNVQAHVLSDSSVQVEWYDPSLDRDQIIRDDRFYTVRYYSYERGQYQYVNTTIQYAMIEDLQPDTDYYFEVRSENQRYRSEWSEQARNRTSPLRGIFMFLLSY